VKYGWIDERRAEYPIRALCAALEVSPSGYYEWKSRPGGERRERRARIVQAAQKFFEESRRIYGYRKVHRDLVAADMACSREMVRQVMRENGWKSKVQRRGRRVVTTDSAHDLPVAANLLNRDFGASRPNEKWVTDITYVATKEGWLYLATVLDLYSRRIVGWSAGDSLATALVREALLRAVRNRLPKGDLLHHSDRGSQYASLEYRNLLEINELTASMSRKANCWDNAPMESFFGSLKTEWLNFEQFANREQAKGSVFEYIEVFYNRRRRHEALDYRTPIEFEYLYKCAPPSHPPGVRKK